MKQMGRSEGSLLHLHSVGCLEDARVCLYCLFLRRSKYLSFFHPYNCKIITFKFDSSCQPVTRIFTLHKTGYDIHLLKIIHKDLFGSARKYLDSA